MKRICFFICLCSVFSCFAQNKTEQYVAKYKDSNDLGKGINWILKSIKEEPKKFEDCRKKAMKKYDINHLADKYILTYKKLLTKNFI